jgi:hypothetical protein
MTVQQYRSLTPGTVIRSYRGGRLRVVIRAYRRGCSLRRVQLTTKYAPRPACYGAWDIIRGYALTRGWVPLTPQEWDHSHEWAHPDERLPNDPNRNWRDRDARP